MSPFQAIFPASSFHVVPIPHHVFSFPITSRISTSLYDRTVSTKAMDSQFTDSSVRRWCLKDAIDAQSMCWWWEWNLRLLPIGAVLGAVHNCHAMPYTYSLDMRELKCWMGRSVPRSESVYAIAGRVAAGSKKTIMLLIDYQRRIEPQPVEISGSVHCRLTPDSH